MAWKLALVVAFAVSNNAFAQTYAANFESSPPDATAEALGLPGLTFRGVPEASFVVYALPTQPEGSFFEKLTGKVLLSSPDGVLEVLFATPVTSFSMDYGVVGSPAPETPATAEGFDASGSSVGKGTASAAPVIVLGSVALSREGTVQLTSTRPFTRVRLTFGGPVGSGALAVDNLRASGSGDPTECSLVLTPSVRSLLSQVWQGQSIPLVVTARPPSEGPVGSVALQIEATSGGVTTLVSQPPAAVDSATNETTVRVATESWSGDVRLRVAAATPGCAFGPYSQAVTVRVVTAPASFVTFTPSVGWLVGIADANPAPPQTTLKIRNSGGTRGQISFNAGGGGFFSVSPTSLTLDPGQAGTITLTASASAVRTTGLSFGRLTSGEDGITVPVTLLVVAGSVAAGAKPNARVTVSSNRLVFTAPNGQTPASQTLAVSVTGLAQTETAIVLMSVGADGSWLVLPSGGFTVTGPGRVEGTFSVDRSRRGSKEAGFARRTLLKLAVVGGLPENFAFVEVLDVEPPAVQSDAGPGRATATGASFVIPTAVKAPGQFGAQFLSDGWLRNESALDVSADFYFTPDGADGLRDPAVKKATLLVPAGRTFRLSDLLDGVFKTTGSGQIEIRSKNVGLLSVRTTVESVTNGDPTSRYGTEIPTVARGAGIGLNKGELVLSGIHENETNRTNLILTETTGANATAQVTVYDENGSLVGTKEYPVQALSKFQVTRLVNDVAPGRTLAGGSATIVVTAGAGKVVALATVIDNRTNSFSVILGQRVRKPTTAGARDGLVTAPLTLVIPSAVRTTGAQNTRFTTSLSLVNGTASPANLKLTYIYTDLEDGQVKTVEKAVPLSGRGSLPQGLGADVLVNLFGVTNRSFGWIRVEGDVGKVVASAAISSQVDPEDPSKGLKTAQVQALLSDSPDILVKDFTEHQFAGAEKSDQKRTNLVLEEVAGLDGDVVVKLVTAAGDVLAEKSYPLTAGQYLQITDLFGSFDLGDGPYQNVQVVAQMKNGTGKVIAFASVIDNESKNPQIFLLKAAGPPDDSTIGF